MSTAQEDKVLGPLLYAGLPEDVLDIIPAEEGQVDLILLGVKLKFKKRLPSGRFLMLMEKVDG